MVRLRASGAACIVALASILAAGCGGGGGAPDGGSRRFGSLVFSMTTTKLVYSKGEPVTATFTVRNIGLRAVNLGVSGFNNAAYNVLSGGQTVSGGGGSGDQDIRVDTIGPGASEVHTVTWDQTDLQGMHVEPGQYTIFAWLPVIGIDGTSLTADQARSDLASDSVQFSIAP